MFLRRMSILAWCAVPLIAIAWHYGPGQPALARDLAAAHLTTARAAAERADHATAGQAFAAALAALPPEDPARPAIELEQAVVTAASGELLQGMDQMSDLLKRLSERGQGDGALARATRSELGEAHYHAAWLMRLEGASTEEWTAEADAARQHFRLLAETAPTPEEAQISAKNLESAVRLQRLDLSELKGLPLPKKCSGNCQSLSQKKRKQRESRSDSPKPGEKKETQDVRQEMRKERDAGKGQRAEGGS
jgi:hypothetical protein